MGNPQEGSFGSPRMLLVSPLLVSAQFNNLDSDGNAATNFYTSRRPSPATPMPRYSHHYYQDQAAPRDHNRLSIDDEQL